MKLLQLLWLFLLLLAACSLSAEGSKKDYEQEAVGSSVGKIILLNDSLVRYEKSPTNPLGAAEAFLLFKSEYENKIKKLSVESRMNFFWSIMWHISLGGGYMEEFQEIVFDDCGDFFVEKLEKYVEIEREVKRSKSRLYLSERVLADLVAMKK